MMARYFVEIDCYREPWLYPIVARVGVDITVTPDDSEYVISIASVDGGSKFNDVSVLTEGEIAEVELAAQALYEREEKLSKEQKPHEAA